MVSPVSRVPLYRAFLKQLADSLQGVALHSSSNDETKDDDATAVDVEEAKKAVEEASHRLETLQEALKKQAFT